MITDQTVCVEHNHAITAEFILRCMGNLIVIGALPFRLGLMGAPFWYLLIYAVVAGLTMTVAEDLRFAQAMLREKDVRNYAKVRIALIAVLGVAPFVAGWIYASE